MRGATAVLAGLTVVGVALGASPPPAAAEAVDELLEEALTASRERPHRATLVLASFSSDGPQLTQLRVTAGADGGLRLTRAEGWELGRDGEHAFLRQPGTLLRVGGTERVGFDIALLREKYTAEIAGDRSIDTGEATILHLRERETGVLRETLYLDLESGLVVRRETFGLDGAPVRVLAFTDLEVGDADLTPLSTDDLEVEEHELRPAEVADLRARGFRVPEQLPRGYRLLSHHEVDDARVPTLHLTYGDGLYTLSLFQQQGQLSMRAVRRADQLTTIDGGAVWRWPGSEPRRLVWSGDGTTFTALADAPTDEILTVIGGLPTDAPPSTLERLARGLGRVGRWLWPGG